MFYSQLLLSKKGALGIVWMAAHCHKRLRKCDIQQTDISSSVDKILDDEVRSVTHRILAFLLLGLVRIHSKKAEYLYNDCHEMLNRLSSIKTRKSKEVEIGVSLTHYYSISLPKRFELDTFDLELVEGQDVEGENARSHGKGKVTDRRRKDASTSNLLRKENAQISGAYSMAYTPPKDVFGHPHVGQSLIVGPSSNKKVSLAGVDVLRGARFSLGDPMVLNAAEDEEIHEKQTDEDQSMNFCGPTIDAESDSDVGPSINRIVSLPSFDILCGTWLGLEDRLEPMVLDEAEEEQLNGRSSNNEEPIQDMELDFINHQSSKGGDYEAEKGHGHEKPPDKEHAKQHPSGLFNFDEGEHQDSTAPVDKAKPVDNVPEVITLNGRSSNNKETIQDMEVDFMNHQSSKGGDYEAEKGHGHEKPPDKEHAKQHPSGLFNFDEGEHQDFIAPVDKAKPVDNVPEVITLESVNSQRPEEFRVSIVTPNSKLPAGAGTSEVAFVQTPGRKERAKIQKKQKLLLDLTTVVVPNKEYKNWIGDATDLKRKRREVAHTLLGAWRANKWAHVPQSFFEPSIPGISVAVECNKRYVPVQKTLELSSEEGSASSPVQEQIPVNRSPKSPRRTLDVQLPVIGESLKQTSIAPGTPTTHFNQLRPHGFGAVADSDTVEPANSYESVVVGKGASLSEPFDVLFEEETSYFEGDSSKGDTFSTRTRMAVSYLSKKFLEKKKGGEEEVLNLSDLLVGKTKTESARFFYETLVLKTRDCIDVQQEAAYHDIVLREKPKLRQPGLSS